MTPAIKDVFDKYFGCGFSQDPFLMHAIRAYSSAIAQFEGWETIVRYTSDALMKGVLDNDDYAIWLSLTSGLREEKRNAK